MAEITPIKPDAHHPSDVTKREAALTSSEETFALLVNAVRDYAIFAMSPEGVIQTWNKGARRLKGYEPQEIIGTHFSRFYTPEDVARNHPAWELEQAKNNGTYEEEGRRVRKDGSRFWANVIITAIHDPSGRLIGYSKVTRDLTEQKKAEDAIQAAYQDLEKRVEIRTAELASAKIEAERALQVRDEFFSIASHELRTPLTSLKLKTQMAKRVLKGRAELSADAKSFQSYVTESGEHIDRLVRLVEDMLDLTRMTTGALSIERSTVDLTEIARKSIEHMSLQFQKTNTPIELKASPGSFVLADPMRIEQVLSNLFTNIFRYAPGNPVEVRVTNAGDLVRLEIQDHGPGIAADHQEQIFNRYERLDHAKNAGGLGIGLYLARAIMQAHFGTIHVESELGKGANFILELPRAAPDQLLEPRAQDARQ